MSRSRPSAWGSCSGWLAGASVTCRRPFSRALGPWRNYTLHHDCSVTETEDGQELGRLRCIQRPLSMAPSL